MIDTASSKSVDVQAIAAEVFELLGAGRQIEPFTSRIPGFDLDDAYRIAALVRDKREARGETPVGRKIGFTNPSVWDEYGYYPVWGTIYHQTVIDLDGADGAFSLSAMVEPLIEPEIVFGLATAPAAGMDERTLLGCIEWVAHGFEIVQSIYPGWKLTPLDVIAAYAVHGALLIGPRHEIGQRQDEWLRTLSAFDIDLACDGSVVDHGNGANVMGGPLSALRHLIEMLAGEPGGPPLAAGEIVTTGTLTRALPISPGETWSTALSGIALNSITVRFT